MPVTFKYALQKVVDLKGSQKAMAEWTYAAALGKQREEETRLAALEQERSTLIHQLARESEQPVQLSRLLGYQQYIETLDEQIVLQIEEASEARKQAQACRIKLSDRMIDEKVWLNAKGRAYERFQAESLATEQQELDEIATVRAAHGSRG